MATKRKSIITGALILTAASVITRILGFIYRIYMSKTIGAEGMGLYQLIMPLYSLTWSICCSGFTTTIAKLVAQENAKRNYGNMGKVLKLSLLITCSIACLLSLGMYFGAHYLAIGLLNDGRVSLSLKILSFALPFMAAGSCIRGYFFGLQESSVPATSQVLEQIVRMSIIYVLAGIMIPRGLVYACAAAVIGIFFGELLSFLYVFYSYYVFKRKNKLIQRPAWKNKQALSLIFAMALPLTMHRITGSLLATIENLLIPQRLEMYGYTSGEAISLYGQISGMALPLIFFPSAILYALSTTLVPAVSEAIAVKNKARISYTLNRALLFTSVIGIGTSTIFITLPDKLGHVIYNQDISSMLFMLGWMCPFWYMNITFSGILNGLGHQMYMFKENLISSVINIACIFFLVPMYGLPAFIGGWFVSLIYVTVSSLLKIRKSAEIHIPVMNWFIKPLLSALATGLTVNYISDTYIFPLCGDIAGLIITIALLGCGFMFFVLLLRVVTINDIKSLFKGLPLRKQQQAQVKEKSIMQ